MGFWGKFLKKEMEESAEGMNNNTDTIVNLGEDTNKMQDSQKVQFDDNDETTSAGHGFREFDGEEKFQINVIGNGKNEEIIKEDIEILQISSENFESNNKDEENPNSIDVETAGILSLGIDKEAADNKDEKQGFWSKLFNKDDNLFEECVDNKTPEIISELPNDIVVSKEENNQSTLKDCKDFEALNKMVCAEVTEPEADKKESFWSKIFKREDGKQNIPGNLMTVDNTEEQKDGKTDFDNSEDIGYCDQDNGQQLVQENTKAFENVKKLDEEKDNYENIVFDKEDKTQDSAISNSKPEIQIVGDSEIRTDIFEEENRGTDIEALISRNEKSNETSKIISETDENKKDGFWGKLLKKEEGNERDRSNVSSEEKCIEQTTIENNLDRNKKEESDPVEIISETTEKTEKDSIVNAVDIVQEEKMGMFGRLKRSLSRTRQNLSGKIENLLNTTTEINDDFYDDLEDILMQADVGFDTTMKLVENIQRSVKKKHLRTADGVYEIIKEEIRNILGEEHVELEEVSSRPAVILVVGVNGAGKTTSIAKMAWKFKQNGSKVLLAAADTFRAAAIDQLEVWAKKVGVDIIKREEGSDPGAVVYDAVAEARKGKYDILIVDTAGRLHNKANLMKEMEKLYKIIGREIPGAPHEVLLVLDATTGQNALIQAKEFSNVASVTGIVLTKLDGTAKGGVIISIASELSIPVKLIGVGEGMEDLREFSSVDFVEALFAVDKRIHNDKEINDEEEHNGENFD